MMLKHNTIFKRLVLSLIMISALMLVISGCKPESEVVLVNEMNISSANNATTISTMGGTLQLSAIVLPLEAEDKSFVWSVENITGQATINANGLLTAVSNGTVSVRATANDDSGYSNTKLITITNQNILVASISINSANDAMTIDSFGGTLQFAASILPLNVYDKSVIWSVINGTGEATITSNGLLKAIKNGTVTVKVTSVEDPTMSNSKIITLSNQEVLISTISISSTNGTSTISTIGGTLQLVANIIPQNIDDDSIIWQVENLTGEATINQNGLLTAVANGTVLVTATSINQPKIIGTRTITIDHQGALTSSVEIISYTSQNIIDTYGGAIRFDANVLPLDADDKSVIWSVINVTGEATISDDGLLRAISDGIVTVKVQSRVDSTLYDTLDVTITNQTPPVIIIDVDSVEIYTTGDVSTISTLDGTLQMMNYVFPFDADDQSVIWSVTNGTGQATISSIGLLTAVSDGTVTVRTTSYENSSIYDEMIITISNQVPPVGTIYVASVVVDSTGNATTINTFGGTLQMLVNVLPVDATDKSVTWSVTNGTGQATIGANGLLTAVANGTVTVRATSNENSSMFDDMIITISNQEVLISSISVAGTSDISVISTFGGTLQMVASVLPLNAFDQSILWTVTNGTGGATINSLTGLLTATLDGSVTVTATSINQPSISGTKVITISNQTVVVTSVVIHSALDATTITTDKATLQFSSEVLPINATNDNIIWSVNDITIATIDQNGLLTAIKNGIVTVKGASLDNVSIFDTMVITVSGQAVINLEDPVDLGAADTFAILSKTGISNTGSTTSITGNIGVSPAAATYITGFTLTTDSSNTFSTSPYVTGNIYAADYTTPENLNTAILDMGTAYTDAASRASDFTELFAGDLSGRTLVPGVYKYSSNVVIYANLTLTGSATDVWIFQIAGTFTQAASVQIILTGGALAENVFWQVAQSAVIETDAHFSGILLTMTNIAVNTNASVNGKLLAQTAVTLQSNTIDLLTSAISATSIDVTSAGNATEIIVDNGTLQMSAAILPLDATYTNPTWSVINGSGEATIDATGLLTAVSNGSVTVKAASAMDPLVFDTMEIVLSNQIVPVDSIELNGFGGATTIETDNGTLQIVVTVLPIVATNQLVTWSIIDGAANATISPSGLVTAVKNGTVTIKAISADNALIEDTIIITISNQIVPVTSVTVNGLGNATTIIVNDGTLQMEASILPVDASSSDITWSVENGTGEASIGLTGLLTAIANGTVTVKATSVDYPLIQGTLVITISNQVVLVTSVTVNGFEDATTIETNDGTLQMEVSFLPINATNKLVTWSVTNTTGEATINSAGLLTAVADGTVVVKVTSDQDPLIFDEITITISNQVIEISGPVDLGDAADFAIFSEAGITTTGVTHINGNIGVSPIGAAAMTGFALVMDPSLDYSTSSLITGMVYAADYSSATQTYLTTTVSDMHDAYTDVTLMAEDVLNLNAGILNGQTLVPGVYEWTTAVSITGDFTLQGSATDVWIFQIAGTLTQAANVDLLFIGAISPENIVWQVAGAVTLGAGAHLEGTLLAMTGVSVGTGATFTGRILARTAVTLDANLIN